MKFKTTFLRVVEVADQLWLNGIKVQGKYFNASLRRLILETKGEHLIFDDQPVDIEFGAFKALTLQGVSCSFQAQMIRHVAQQDLS